MSEFKIEFIKKIGFSEDEINLYGIDFLLQYLKYHHVKGLTIAFLGFDDEDLMSMKVKAIDYGLGVRVSSLGVTFVCVNIGFKGIRKLNNAIEKGALVLSKIEFSEIFRRRDYQINKNENIYLKNIREEFRITKPLSNFDYVAKVGSFSFNSESKFDVNLYRGTCNCSDFRISKRYEFQQGDLRRYCKHLILYYNDYFNPRELSDIKKFLIQDCRAIRKNFRNITLLKVEKPIYLNYNLDDDEGCDIYFPYKNNEYEKFCYNFKDEWFSYEDKPIGYVKDLRIELNKIFRPEKEFYKKKKSREETKEIDANVNGCIYFFVFIVIVLILIFS